MSTPDYSIGFTRDEVEDILAIHKAEIKKTLSSRSDSGSSATKRRLDEIHVVIAACQDALVKIAPQVYGEAKRIAQSRLDFIPR